MNITLYHFTCLAYLPEVLRDGINRGEIPVSRYVPYEQRPNAPNLTRNPSPNAQLCWTEIGATDKTRVRLKIVLPKTQVRTFKRVQKQYGIARDWVKTLAPRKEHLDWFFAKGDVSPEYIAEVDVALEKPGKYSTVAGAALEELIQVIESELKRVGWARVGHVSRCDRPSPMLLDGPSLRRGNCFMRLPLQHVSDTCAS